jgi:hypothetical protein
MLLLGFSRLSRPDDTGRGPKVSGPRAVGEAVHSGVSRCCGLNDTGRASGCGRCLTNDVLSFDNGPRSGSFVNAVSGLKADVGLSGLVHLSRRSESLSSLGPSWGISTSCGAGSCLGGSSTGTTSGVGSSLTCTTTGASSSFGCFGCSSAWEVFCCSYIGRSSHRVVTDFSRCRLFNASSEPAMKSSMRWALAGSLLIGRGCLSRGCTSSWE